MCNPLQPFPYKISRIIKDTEHEWTYQIEYNGTVSAGQFFQVSIPRVGEMPISVSGINDGYLEMTIRKVGKVTGEIFKMSPGSTIFMRGPYGTSFNLDDYRDRNLIIIAGGSGTAPVRPVIEHYYQHPDEIKSLDIIFGFRSPEYILFRKDIDRWSEKFNMVLTIDKPVEGWTGNSGLVTEFIDKLEIEDGSEAAGIIVGPPVMIGFCAEALMKKSLKENRITVSLERRMACGIGKCGRCKIGDIYICQEGPIMNYSKAAKLID
jgi:anaerobic sulfite reductase subunit B